MLHEAGFAPQDICRVTGHRNAESLKHYIDAASTRKTVEAADVLEDLVNPENSVERHNSDLVATQAASSSVPAPSSSVSSVHNFSFDLNINVEYPIAEMNINVEYSIAEMIST